jgi:hypothetical protein
MRTISEISSRDPMDPPRAFLQILVYSKVVWWGLQVNLGHDEWGYSST